MDPLPELSLDQGMPASLDAERSILGAILLEQKHIEETLAGIDEADFSLESHRRIYRRMLELHSTGHAIDLVTLVEELARRKEVEQIGGVAYIASLTEGLPRRISIAEYVRIVADKSIARQLIGCCHVTMTRAGEQRDYSADLIRRLTENLLDITARAKTILHRAPEREILVGALDFILNAPKEISWLLDGIIQADGNGVIVGDPKASKSLASLDMLIHLVAGAPWLGRKIPRPVRCALFSREDSPGLTQRRSGNLMEAASDDVKDGLRAIDLNKSLYFNSRAQSETFSLEKESDMQEVIQALRVRKVEFALFDVFRTLWSGDENDNQEVAGVVAQLARIQSEAKCSVALIHHVSKSGEGTIFQRMRGASSLYGWAEWAIGITTANPEAPFRDRVRKMVFETKAAEPADPIHYRIDSTATGTSLTECEAPAAPIRRSRKKTDQDSLYSAATSWSDRG